MVPWRQADPGRELAFGSETPGLRGLHFQQHRADRADARDLGQPSAAFIGAMPSDQSGIDLFDLRLQLRIFIGLGRKQLPSQGRQVLIGLDALKQTIKVSPPLAEVRPNSPA
jgi:hypothetical protein